MVSLRLPPIRILAPILILATLLSAPAFAAQQKDAASVGYDTLVGRLDNRDPVIRREACRLLGELGDKRAVEPLGKMVKDLDEETRFRAVEALSSLLDRGSIPHLAAASADPSRRVKVAAVDGMVTLYVSTPGPSGIKETVTSVFHRAVDLVRQPANELIVSAGTPVDPRVIDALGKASGDPDDEAAKSAARGAGILRGNAAVPAMSGVLFHAPPAVKIEILRAFQKIRDSRASPEVARLLKNSDKAIRGQAAYTLGLLNAREQTAALHQLFQEERDKDVRHNAFEATALMPEARDGEWYSKFLDDPDDRLREFSAEAVGRLPESALPAGTVARLNDRHIAEKSVRVKLALAFALVSHGKNESLGELMQSLESQLHRQYGISYLTELGRDTARLPLYYPFLKSEKADIRRYLCDVLANIANPAALDSVRPLIQDSNNNVITSAIRTVQILERFQK